MKIAAVLEVLSVSTPAVVLSGLSAERQSSKPDWAVLGNVMEGKTATRELLPSRFLCRADGQKSRMCGVRLYFRG
jgi:hypothetical protein